MANNQAASKVVVSPGMQAFRCICKNGTVFVPVTMKMMAKLRHGFRVSASGKCHANGHTQHYSLEAWPPFPLTRARSR